MKSIFFPGKKVGAACEWCRREVTGTYGYGTVELEDGTPVDDVMRATCEACGHVVAIAAQSTPLIRAAIEARERKRVKKTNVRISAPLADFARWTLFNHDARETENFELLFKAFAASLAGAPERRWVEVTDRLKMLHDEILEQPNDYPVTLSLNHGTRDVLARLQKAAGLSNFSELVRRVLVLMEDDKKAELELQKMVMVE